MTDMPPACRVCGAIEVEADHAALHLGRMHGASLTPDERARFEEALEREAAWLAGVRRHARGGLAIVPFALIYASILVALQVSGSQMVLGLLLAPGVVAFCALTYVLAAGKT